MDKVLETSLPHLAQFLTSCLVHGDVGTRMDGKEDREIGVLNNLLGKALLRELGIAAFLAYSGEECGVMKRL